MFANQPVLILLLLIGSSDGLIQTITHPTGLLELRFNRQAKLNALNRELIAHLHNSVMAAKAPEVTGLLISAEPGRAFCAGGDIKEVAALSIEAGRAFLKQEYEVMASLHQLNAQKPIVALADGIVFGAGAGLFMAAGTRIASSASTFSMPECALGIVPDAGGTDYLAAMPGALGRWAALTGARLAAPAMAFTGLATHATGSEEDVAELRARLIQSQPAAFQDVLAREAEDSASLVVAAEPELRRISDAAARVFGSDDGGGPRPLEHLRSGLADEAARADSAGDLAVEQWATSTIAQLDRSSPAALILADAAAQLEWPSDPYARRQLALGAEYAVNCALAERDDFQEGVSCAVGDRKGEAPRWKHASVTEAMADHDVMAVCDLLQHARPLSPL